MKRYFYLLFFAAALLALSCAREPSVTQVSSPGAGNLDADADGVIQGWVRMRLAEEAAPLRVGAFTRGEANSGDAELDRLAAKFGATEIRRVFPTDPRFAERHRKYGLHLWYDVKFDEEVSVSRAQTEFASVPGVAHVQPIYRIQALSGADYPFPSETMADVPQYEGNQGEMPFDDPGLPLQWHYDNDGSLPNSVAGADIGVFDVWKNITGGDPSIIVAVMDAGVLYSHPDIADNMWINEAELNGTDRIDDDGNGYWDDIYGYDFHNRTGKIEAGAHGTHVAGTIAAVNNNGIGVCGVAGGTGNGDGVRIMTCPIYDVTGTEGTPSPEAYIYAADNGAVISQNSWGYDVAMMTSIPQDMSVAFDYFINEAGTDKNGNQTGPMKGGLIVFSAGNREEGVVGLPGRDPRVIGVTAMKPSYAKSGYSNYGVDADIFAPGGAGDKDKEFGIEGKVYSLGLDDGYAYMSGTSMACPHVSGVAALIIAHYGVGREGFTNEELKTILLRSYRNVDAYQGDKAAIIAGLGVGLVDASLMVLENPGLAPAAPAAVTVAPGTKENRLTVTVEGIPADGNEMGIAHIRLSYAPEGTADGSDQWKETVIPCRVSPGGSIQQEVYELADATAYVFRASAVDRFGNESEVTEGKGKTIEHINRPPAISKPLARIDLPRGDGTQEEDFFATVELSDYFTDPDLPQDELSFAVASKDGDIVKASLEGSLLTVEGLKKGETYVTVTVTDRPGESVSKNMAVRVLKERESEPTPPPTPGGDKVELREGELNLFPNPAPDNLYLGVGAAAGLTMDIAIYDSAARKVASAEGLPMGAQGSEYESVAQYDVSSLAPGAYSVTATLSDGRRLKASFLKK